MRQFIKKWDEKIQKFANQSGEKKGWWIFDSLP
jgi:hypothetical protein